MPAFTATDRDGVIDFVAESYELDPTLSYNPDFVNGNDDEGEIETSFQCTYRGPWGERCAFSRCLTEEELEFATTDEIIEGTGASLVIPLLPVAATFAFESIGDDKFWNTLQHIHDAVARLQDSSAFSDPEFDAEDLPRMYRTWRDLGYPFYEEDATIIEQLARVEVAV